MRKVLICSFLDIILQQHATKQFLAIWPIFSLLLQCVKMSCGAAYTEHTADITRNCDASQSGIQHQHQHAADSVSRHRHQLTVERHQMLYKTHIITHNYHVIIIISHHTVSNMTGYKYVLMLNSEISK